MRRGVVIGLLLGALIFAGAIGAKVVNVTNPLSANLDAAGHDILLNGGSVQGPGVIGNLDLLNSGIVVYRSDNPASIMSGSDDPSVTVVGGQYNPSGTSLSVGSLYLRSQQDIGVGQVWLKTGTCGLCWTKVAG